MHTLRYSPTADSLGRDTVTVTYAALGIADQIWMPQKGLILIDSSLDPVARHSSLAHMLAHLDLGHRVHDAGTAAGREHVLRQEVAADTLVAGRLVYVDDIVAALLVHGSDASTLAYALGVSVSTLANRMRSLAPAEWDRIRLAGPPITWPAELPAAPRCLIGEVSAAWAPGVRLRTTRVPAVVDLPLSGPLRQRVAWTCQAVG
ncbi:ImmA/IrrE family metallo-endopeptidase [Rhodococcus maanshanensis]|uniref:ImmA/IrrE family metallo-endopeptidase n=1 Tax=Rhodococcus maanshanensis TaxID=183556 RepID=UPI0022B58ABF|nr:ImmA/IrrE family metallo-endopeptidase [Rhodococcus maanshanensis]MCZ4557922.1 ImmA/IrrE family metallo-endopeptidase [Rhodococcus maanshanensis]